jgi:hypothetical protein
MTFCYDVPIDGDVQCDTCIVRHICMNEYGELADRDSEHCRLLNYHLVKRLRCDKSINLIDKE